MVLSVPKDPLALLDRLVARARFLDPLDPLVPPDLLDPPVLLDRQERLVVLVLPDRRARKESKETRETRAIEVVRVLPEQLDLQSAW
jgi:hypothetical protein